MRSGAIAVMSRFIHSDRLRQEALKKHQIDAVTSTASSVSITIASPIRQKHIIFLWLIPAAVCGAVRSRRVSLITQTSICWTAVVMTERLFNDDHTLPFIFHFSRSFWVLSCLTCRHQSSRLLLVSPAQVTKGPNQDINLKTIFI